MKTLSSIKQQSFSEEKGGAGTGLTTTKSTSPYTTCGLNLKFEGMEHFHRQASLWGFELASRFRK